METGFKIVIFILGIVLALYFKKESKRIYFLASYYGILVPLDAYFYFKELLLDHQANGKPWATRGFRLYEDRDKKDIFREQWRDPGVDIEEFYSPYFVDLNEHGVFHYLFVYHYAHVFIVFICCVAWSYSLSDLCRKAEREVTNERI